MIFKQIFPKFFRGNQKLNFFQPIKQKFQTTSTLLTEIQANTQNHAADEVEQKSSKRKFQEISGKSGVITNFLVNVKSKKRRDETKMMLLEGKRLIQDGIDAGMQPIALFFSRYYDIADFQLEDKVQLYRLPYKDLQFWSDVSTTQGVMGIFPIPDFVNFNRSFKLPLTIVCDNVRDPGNMGSILRTSAAVGCSRVLLTRGCVDLWEPKVLRSAAGAHFRLNIVRSIPWVDIEGFLPEGCKIFLADSDIPEPEATAETYELKDGVKIPINDESKRLTSFQNRPNDSQLPLHPYTETDYNEANEIILVLGGETEGLSKEAYHLASTKQGNRIYIPMANGVESLNSGTALGILAYEIRRQRLSD